jgi:hypothetical protein
MQRELIEEPNPRNNWCLACTSVVRRLQTKLYRGVGECNLRALTGHDRLLRQQCTNLRAQCESVSAWLARGRFGIAREHAAMLPSAGVGCDKKMREKRSLGGGWTYN